MSNDHHRQHPAARPLVAAAALALFAAAAAPATAQQHDHAHHHHAAPTEGLRAELIRDLDGVAQKYLALADAMSGHYDWRPAEGVRSAGEVFMHMAAANFAIPAMIGGPLPEGMTMEEIRGLERVTDQARIRETLEHSFRHLSHIIAGTTDGAMEEPTTLFGREMTRRAALLLMTTHAHEHLGQAIAYARVNGVVPPWSAGD